MMLKRRNLSTKLGKHFIARMVAVREAEDAQLLKQIVPDPLVVSQSPGTTDQAPERALGTNMVVYILAGVASLTLIVVVFLTWI